MPLLRKFERQCESPDVHRMSALGFVAHRLDLPAYLAEELVDFRLIQPQIFSELLRVHLKIINDACIDTARSHEQFYMRGPHDAAIRELSANVFHHCLRSRGKEFSQFVSRRDLPSVSLSARLSADVEQVYEAEIAKNAQSNDGVLIIRNGIHSRGHKS